MTILPKRNGSRMITGNDASIFATAAALILLLLAVISVWEYAAQNIVGFAARHSNPSDIVQNLYDNAQADLRRFGLTAVRGGVGIAIAFFIAYPIGALFPCIGFTTKFAGALICFSLALPKLAVILITLRITGYSEVSVYVIGLWSACIMMVGLGYFHSLNFITDKGESGLIVEAAVVDGSNWFSLYWNIILPLLRPLQVSSLYVLSGSVWTSTTFGEALVLSNIQGLGERMAVKIQFDSTLGHFYAASFLLLCLEVGTWISIFIIQRILGQTTKLFPLK